MTTSAPATPGTTPAAITRQYPDIYDAKSPLSENRERKRLFVAIRHLLRVLFGIDEGNDTTADPYSFPNNFTESAEIRFAAVYGQLVLAGFEDPSLGRLERGTAGSKDILLDGKDGLNSAGKPVDFGQEPDPIDPTLTRPFRVLIVPEFTARFTEAVKDFNANRELYKQAWMQLRDQSTGQKNGAPTVTRISTKLLAEVTLRLITEEVAPDDPQVQLQTINALAQSLGGVVDAHPSALTIDLPDLDAGTSIEIVADNLRAVQAIYYSAQLEDMKMHAVAEKLVEHFQTGMMPISRGTAADKIYTWIKEAPRRLSEFERRGIYGRVLGLAQGSASDPMPNREFPDLWQRFLATVSLKAREVNSSERYEVSLEQIHKAARDLAVNLSLHGYGIAHPAAIEMQRIARDVIAILDEPAVLRAYGVNDRWQLVDRVSALYLGGALNGVKYRTMASAGEKVIKWLADRAALLASGSSSSLDLFDAGNRPRPSFRTIADLSERWLAVTGTTDASVMQQTDPVDLRTQYTVPMLGQQANGASNAGVGDVLRQVGVAVPGLPAIGQA